jgi:hypothetical protein
VAWGSLLSGTTTTDGLNGSVDSDWIEGFDGHDHLGRPWKTQAIRAKILV